MYLDKNIVSQKTTNNRKEHFKRNKSKEDRSVKFFNNPLPGHLWVLHGIGWLVVEPTQSFPHFEGAGLLHDRVLIFTPPPHFLLHFPGTQSPQPPFAKNEDENVNSNLQKLK